MPAIILILSLASSISAAPLFTAVPTLVKSSDSNWTISFTLSEYTDVEVAIVDLKDSMILARLAAGRLGPDAPAPLTPNTLSQTLSWDGRTDLRKPVPATARPGVRVRAGLSTALSNIVPSCSPHLFSVTLTGLNLDPDGSLYAFGNNCLYNGEFGNSTMQLRKYDRSGEYLKTLFPPPAGTAPSAVSRFGSIGLPGSRFRLSTWMAAGPGLGDPLNPITGQTSIFCPFKINGHFMIVNHPGNFNPNFTFALVSPNSECLAVAPLITSPTLPLVHDLKGPWIGGPMYLSLWPDGKSLLVSALYEADTNHRASAWFPADTGFWRDGRIFRIDLTTGVAVPFLSLDPAELPKTDSARKAVIGPRWAGEGHLRRMAAIHGTAFDDSGHLFICDRLHQRIGVYDTLGTFLSSFPVTDPDVITVDNARGTIYVLTRNITTYGGGFIHLYKYSGWRNPQVVAARLNVTIRTCGASSILYGPRASLVLDTNSSTRVLWVASNSGGATDQSGFWRFEDRGDTLVRTFASSDRFAESFPDPDRLAVDPATGTLFIQHPYTALSKIDDWSAPKMRPCSTTAGARLYAADMQVSPAGFLYLRQMPGGGKSSYPKLDRWTLGPRHEPAPFTGLNTNLVTGSLSEHFSNGVAAHGMDIFRDSLVAVIHRAVGEQYYLQVWDTTGTLVAESLLTMTGACGGVQFDQAGNVYTGVLCWADSHAVPDSFAGDWGYTHYVGTVVKFDRSRHGYFKPSGFSKFSGTPRDVNPQNAVRVYRNTPVAPFSGYDKTNTCVCRVPRFAVDPYGRIFTANAITGSVSVADNNDNLLHRFGEYGNVDSRGPGVPLMWPTSAVADDDFIYVSDPGNFQVLRVAMRFALNNMPGFSALERAPNSMQEISLDAAPNPFSSRTRLILRSNRGSHATLKIYDARGRPIRTLLDGKIEAGPMTLRWDCRDESGSRVATGVYLFTFTTMNKRKILKAAYLQ